MSDMRDLEPKEREFKIGTKGSYNYEAEICVWGYHSINMEKVIAEKLVYKFSAEDFDSARLIVDVALQTVRAMHDVWKAKIVRIEEKG